MTALLEVEALSKRFGGIQALQDVNFEVLEGSITGLMGANGAGKTTLFSLIAGNERPTRGNIRFRGQPLVGLRPDQICRRGIARTFQIVRPFAGLSVRENVATAAVFGARRHADAKAATAFAERVAHEVGLAARLDDPAASLTLAGQKRLEVARAVATGAELVMLDEVMAGLTPVEVEQMLETLRALHAARGLTLLVIEHVMRALMRLSNQILVLHLGRRIAYGTPGDIIADAAVAKVYFGTGA
jgi:branched-chain amino acid transport system ATP-binding protein